MSEAELIAAENAEIDAMDERLTVAQMATRAATEARARSLAASGLPFTSHGVPSTFDPATVQALAAATSAEEAALVARNNLHTQINAARAARKDPSR